MFPAPVKEVTVQPIGVEKAKGPFAGGQCPGARSILGKNFRNQEDRIASPGNGLADDLLSVAVHLRSIEMGHAKIETETQGGNRQSALAAIDVQGALANHRN